MQPTNPTWDMTVKARHLKTHPLGPDTVSMVIKVWGTREAAENIAEVLTNAPSPRVEAIGHELRTELDGMTAIREQQEAARAAYLQARQDRIRTAPFKHNPRWTAGHR